MKKEKGCFLIESGEAQTLKEGIQKMQQAETTCGIIFHPKEVDILEGLKKQFLVIPAAGGLVLAPEKHVLMIFRRGKWDLPKGKLDEGESLEDCALREVEEETGLQGIENDRKIGTTYHTYYEKNNTVLKESHWYLMRSRAMPVLTPQTEEDIEKCEWVQVKNLAPYMENTHPSILDVLQKGMHLLGLGKNV